MEERLLEKAELGSGRIEAPYSDLQANWVSSHIQNTAYQ